MDLQTQARIDVAGVILPPRLLRRTLRERAGLSLAMLGTLVDPARPVDPSVISRWERVSDPVGDRRRAYGRILAAIAEEVVPC